MDGKTPTGFNMLKNKNEKRKKIKVICLKLKKAKHIIWHYMGRPLVVGVKSVFFFLTNLN